MRLIGLILLSWPVLAQIPLPQILERVSEEAEVFLQNAPKVLSHETLEQRAYTTSRVRIGNDAGAAKTLLRTREIVSEYTLGRLPGSNSLVEFRQVTAVDGKPVTTPEKARHALSMNLRAPTEAVRKRMLENFQRYGLPGAAASDFGPVLLLFTKRQLPSLQFTPAGTDRVGADRAVVLDFQQLGGGAGAVEFHNSQTTHIPLKGKLTVRESDGLPLRVSLVLARRQDGRLWRDEAVVDYAMTAHGFLAPVSVTHKRYVDDQLTVDSLYRYATFRRFGAEAEIKFSGVPDPEK